ncbi:hypothetical protein EIP91_010587 [Steccherinum ochraceum]|uniref:Uncharacterized protein n=1 Tax=Steccherinum ochraceum TaxID=92696 RepID=A0A4R0RJF7_9APHY|nr:hypothetical protein EIP91_010587 [Steccherinum ochraceum]
MRFAVAFAALVAVASTAALAAPLRDVPRSNLGVREDFSSLTVRDIVETLNELQKRVDGDPPANEDPAARAKRLRSDRNARYHSKPKTADQKENRKSKNLDAVSKYQSKMTDQQKEDKKARDRASAAKRYTAKKQKEADEREAAAAAAQGHAPASEAGPAPPESPPLRPSTPVDVAVQRGTANPHDIFGPR